jgi:hypothetical protein
VLLLLRCVAGFCSATLGTLQPLDDLIALWQKQTYSRPQYVAAR